jgi:hypothetical protein
LPSWSAPPTRPERSAAYVLTTVPAPSRNGTGNATAASLAFRPQSVAVQRRPNSCDQGQQHVVA